MMIEKRGTVASSGRKRSFTSGRNTWLAGTALGGIGAAVALALPQLALANPTDGHVTAGSVNIVTVSPNQLDIVQSSKKAIINWGDFSIGSGETTNFLQPGRNSWTLNRVTGGNPSAILGSAQRQRQCAAAQPERHPVRAEFQDRCRRPRRLHGEYRRP